MQIYPAVVDDARCIAQIHVATWQAAYAGIVPDDYLAGLSVDQREVYWRQEIPLGKQAVALAKSSDTVVGWVSYGPSRKLWLHAREHLAEQGFQSVSLWVLAANTRAIDFYVKAGFVPDLVSAKEFVIGGATLTEIRYTAELPIADTSEILQ